MAHYTCPLAYIRCSTGTKDKIQRINNIISLLEDAELSNALDQGVEEYRLDDGQTTIKTSLRSFGDIEAAIAALEKRKNRLINSCLGYRYGLRDGNVRMR